MPDGCADLQEDCLWRRYRENADSSARSMLIDRYHFLARKVAASLFARRVDDEISFDDYLQFGIAGLIESIDRYEPGRGASFATFASYRIRGSIVDGLEKMSEKRSQNAYMARVRRERLESIAAGHGGRKQVLFDEMVEVALGLAIGFMLEDTGLVEGADAGVLPRSEGEKELSQLRRCLLDTLEKLPDRERAIVERHYFHGKSFDAVSREQGVTKGRISQLHKRALQRMREALLDVGRLDDYL